MSDLSAARAALRMQDCEWEDAYEEARPYSTEDAELWEALGRNDIAEGEVWP